MGSDPAAGGHRLLWLGAQMAEIEALYGCALQARDPEIERRMLIELAGAGARLAELARASAGPGDAIPVRIPLRLKPAAPRRSVQRRSVRRRIARTQRTTEWIITRLGSAEHAG